MSDRLPATTASRPQKRFSLGLAGSDEERIEHREWVGGAIRTILSIYGDWPSDPRLQAEWGKAWADDLEWFSQEIIAKALTTWRRSETKRPTPADIIRLCREHLPAPKAVQPPRRERPEVSEDAKARNRKIIAAAFPDVRFMPRSAE